MYLHKYPGSEKIGLSRKRLGWFFCMTFLTQYYRILLVVYLATRTGSTIFNGTAYCDLAISIYSDFYMMLTCS